MHTHGRNAIRGMSAAILTLAIATTSSAATVATFADPAANETTPLFEATGTSISGGWSGMGLDLIVPIAGAMYPDATFEMDPVTVNPDDTLGAGEIRFFDNGGALVLQVNFDGGALFEPFGFGASFLSGDDVMFSGPVIAFPLVDETFAFSFANPMATPNGMTYTAAFTSSAVPEPTSLVLLLAGAVMFALRRR